MAEQLTDFSVLLAPCLGPPNHTSSPLPPSIGPQSIGHLGIGQGIGAALAQARQSPRAALPFRAVNQRDKPGYDPGMQRHHLLPNQVLSARCFGHFFNEIGALLRLKLLQGAVRRRLLEQGRKRLTLNRFDPLGREADFSQMDEMVDALWPATEPVLNTPVNEAELGLILHGGGREQRRARAGGSAFSF